MSTPQILTDEQAAAIWSGETASIQNFQAPAKVELDEPAEDQEDKEDKPETKVLDEDITNVFAGVDEDEDEDEPVKQPDSTKVATTSNEPKKAGRKPAELVGLVNQLVEEEVLFGYEEGEIKTIEEAKDLIKENLKYKEETAQDSFWKKKVESYSPQVQAILHYAERGGQDIAPLLSAIAEVEKSSELDVKEESSQEEIVRQVLKIKGFDEEEIKDQIETLKDLGRLEQKATKFLPELNKMKEQRIHMMLQEQEEQQRQAEEAANVYVQTIQKTLDKEVVGPLKLKREDKYKILEALATPKYRSINGFQVNEFVKALEDMQFGKNADYDHFLNVVHFTVDKDGFIEKLKETIKSEVSADTIRKLKTAKQGSANSQQELEPETNPKKNVIQRGGFKNPYAR